MMMQTIQSDILGTSMPHVAGILSFDPKAKVPLKLVGIHSFKTRASVHSFIASHISNSYLIWILDSGATDHICISLRHMHNITNLKTPIFINLPNGQTVKVTITGSVHLTNSPTLHNVMTMAKLLIGNLNMEALPPTHCVHQPHTNGSSTLTQTTFICGMLGLDTPPFQPSGKIKTIYVPPVLSKI
ncbi:hypothetical protein Tco_0366106 [Tanacetum coccineum]